jgi:uncharacterized protein YdiU (UPF0061 family)
MIVQHLIERQYRPEIKASLPFSDQVVELARLFRARLTALVAHWLRVGYCQGNFNSDNCAAGGFTLDYGPFGFIELFDPGFQPWTGGGEHFCYFNQPAAAEANYQMFWAAIRLLLEGNAQALAQLDGIREGFAAAMQAEIEAMWTRKLGLLSHDAALVDELLQLLVLTKVDMTIFFRRLSHIPDTLASLKDSFYLPSSEDLDARWERWLQWWRQRIHEAGDPQLTSAAMRCTNPAITWREWQIAPAYQEAEQGSFHRIEELQELFSHPYEEPSTQLAATFDRLRPQAFFYTGGVSHYSCSS